MLTALREGSEGFMLARKKDLKSCEPQSCCCDKPNKFQLTSKNEFGRSRRTPFVIILRIFRNIVESWLLDYSFFADIAPEIRASKVETSFGQSGPCKRKHFSSKTIWSTLPAHCLKSR